jgi:DNA-binding winged helix-turn-helix (wHTH) protein/Tol biopolymer transport system component
MPARSLGSRRLRFGGFHLNLETGELERKGRHQRLQGQPLEILKRLLETPGELVSREELKKRVWNGDTFVDFDQGLNNSIQKLREVLGDSASSPRFIETIPKRGYRFIGPGPEVAENLAPVLQLHVAEKLAPTRDNKSLPRRVAIATVLLVAGVVGWYVGLSSKRNHHPLEHRLTSSPSDTPITSAAISPDGKLLAWADKTGSYFRQVDTGEVVPISWPGPSVFTPDSWFPDSIHLLGQTSLSSKPDSALWKMSILGGSPEKVMDDAYGAAVSPDGAKIAFLRNNPIAVDAETEIWIAEPNQIHERKILQAGKGEVLTSLSWSPTGRRVAYYRRRFAPVSEFVSLETVDVITGQTGVVRVDHAMGLGLGWTSDGRILFSQSPREPPSLQPSDLWSIRVDSNTGIPRGEPILASQGRGAICNVSVTRDGKIVSLLRDTSAPQVFVGDLNLKTETLRELRRLTNDDNVNVPFSWTPDSKSVLFMSARNLGLNIFRQALNENVAELLVGGSDRSFGPRLSPDGSEFYYLVLPKDGNPVAPVSLMRKSFAGGPPLLMLQEPGIPDVQCARSPSNVCVFIKLESEGGTWYALDPTTKAKGKALLHLPGTHYNYGLSPDGLQIALVDSQRQGTIQFVLLSTGAIREVTVKGTDPLATLSTVDWLPSGKGLVVSTEQRASKVSSLLHIKMNGESHVLMNGDIGWAVPSPDGRHLAVVQTAGESNVWILDDF